MLRLLLISCAFLCVIRTQAELIDPALHTESKVPWDAGEMIGDPNLNYVYVANESDQLLLAINTETGQVDAVSPTIGVPGRMTFSHDGERLYLGSSSAQRFQVFEPGTLRCLDTVSTGTPLEFIVIGSDGHLYTTDQGSLYKLDLATGEVLGSSDTRFYGAPILRINADGSRIFVMEKGLSGGGSGSKEYEVTSGMPTLVTNHYNSKSNDQDLTVDTDDDRLYRSSGGVYGVGAWSMDTRTYNYWPFTGGAAYGVAVIQQPDSPYVYGASGDSYNGRIVKYNKATGTPVFTYRTDDESPTGIRLQGYADINRDRLEISANGHLVYGKDDEYIGLIGGGPLNMTPTLPMPYIYAGVSQTKPANKALLLTSEISNAGDNPDLPPSDNLLAWYPLDATNILDDLSGANRHLTATALQSVPGKIGEAAQFNGTNANANLSNHLTAFQASNQGSISFWFKTSEDGPILQCYESSNLDDFFEFRVENGYLYVNAQTSSFYSSSISSKYRIDNERWHHAAIVTTTNNTQLYVDGESLGTINRRAFFSARDYDVAMVGRDQDNNYFTGSLDDLRIYSRVLTAAEVMNIAANFPASSAPVTVSWSQISGPARAHIYKNGDKNIVKFFVPGEYVIQATATRGAENSSDLVRFTITDLLEDSLVAAGTSVRYIIPYSSNDLEDGTGAPWAAVNFDDSGWPFGIQGLGYDLGADSPDYEAYLGVDTEWFNYAASPSILTRKQFTIEQSENLESLSLHIRYDDAAAIYLNGQLVSLLNAPASPSWDSNALSSRTREDAAAYEVIDLSPHLELLVDGQNLLAIQVMNVDSLDDTLLLDYYVTSRQSTKQLYFDAWAIQNPGSSTNPYSTSNIDSDCWGDFLEYAFGSDPNHPTSQFAGHDNPVEDGILQLGPNHYYTVSFVRRTDAESRGLSYGLLFSNDMSAWHPMNTNNYNCIELSPTPLDEGFELANYRLTSPLTETVLTRLNVTLE